MGLRTKCERCDRLLAKEGERFCQVHRYVEFKAMKAAGYLTKVPRRPYITPDMTDPWPGYFGDLSQATEEEIEQLIGLIDLGAPVESIADLALATS